MVGDDLRVVAANRQFCPTISEMTFGNLYIYENQIHRKNSPGRSRPRHQWWRLRRLPGVQVRAAGQTDQADAQVPRQARSAKGIALLAARAALQSQRYRSLPSDGRVDRNWPVSR